MQKITHTITKTVVTAGMTLSIAFMFGISGLSQAIAQTDSTYVLDLTGNGCGNNCSDFYQYLNQNGVSVSSVKNQNTSTSSTNGNTNTVPANTNAPASSATRSTASNSTGYVQYPYYSYVYFQNPASATSTRDTYNYVQYPEQVYVYYGKDVAEQMKPYSRARTSSYGTSSNTNSGFTITSIIK